MQILTPARPENRNCPTTTHRLGTILFRARTRRFNPNGVFSFGIMLKIVYSEKITTYTIKSYCLSTKFRLGTVNFLLLFFLSRPRSTNVPVLKLVIGLMCVGLQMVHISKHKKDCTSFSKRLH